MSTDDVPALMARLLMDEILPGAQQQMAVEGNFDPTLGFLSPAGTFHRLSYDSLGAIVSVEHLRNVYALAMQELRKRGECVGSVMACHVANAGTDKSGDEDKVVALLDHVDDYSVEISIPLLVDDDGSVKFGEARIAWGTGAVFGEFGTGACE